MRTEPGPLTGWWQTPWFFEVLADYLVVAEGLGPQTAWDRACELHSAYSELVRLGGPFDADSPEIVAVIGAAERTGNPNTLPHLLTPERLERVQRTHFPPSSA